MKKVLALCMNDVEEIELLTPIDLLRRADIEIDLVSFEKDKSIKGSHNILINVDKNIDDIELEEYDAIFFPGGPGFKKYDNEKIKGILKYFYEKDKYIFAICAAPSFLARQGVLKGKKATVFKGMENILLENEVIYINEYFVRDGNILTARSVSSSFKFSLEIIEMLSGIEKRKAIEEMIIY